MGISEMLTDVRNHLEHGAELVASHLPALAEWAAKAEADPLVQAALSLVVPEGTRVMLAGLLKNVEADAQRIASEAAAAEQAKAAAAAEQAAAVPASDTPIADAGAAAVQPQVVSADS